MKKQSNFMPEMTRREIEAFLQTGNKVILPVGSTEQHGPHLPISTDVLIPVEIAKRAGKEVNALVAPPIVFGLSIDHKPAGGVIYLKLNTLCTLIGEVTLALAEQGFREVIVLNGHYSNAWAVHHALNEIQPQLPAGAKAFGFDYWAGMPPEQGAGYISPSAGIHANIGETSAVLAIAPDLVDMEKAPNEFPEFPKLRTGVFSILNSYFLSYPGSFAAALETGAWGDATQSTEEKGETFLQQLTQATVNMIRDIEDTYEYFAKKKK